MNLTGAMGLGIFLLGAAAGAMLITLQRAAYLWQLRSLQADRVYRKSRFRAERNRRRTRIGALRASAEMQDRRSVNSDEFRSALPAVRSLEGQNAFLLRTNFDKN